MHPDFDASLKSVPDEAAQPSSWKVRDIVAVCWRARWIVGTVALIGAAAGAALGGLTPSRYEASSTFLVTRHAGLQTALRTFEAILKSNGLADELVRDFKLDQPPTSVTAASFMRDHLLVEQVRDTNLLRAHVTLPDPKLTADVANGLAPLALKLYDSLSTRASIGPSADDLERQKTRRDEAIAAKDDAEQRLLAFRSEAQLDARRRGANDLLDRAREAVQDDHDPAAAGRVGGAPPEPGRRRQRPPGAGTLARELTRTEVVTPVYGQLEAQMATLRANVAALEAEQQELASRVKQAGSALSQLVDIYRRETELARIQREFEAAERLASSMSSQYDQMRDTVAEMWPRPELVDAATVPDEVLSRGALAGLVAGLLAGVLGGLVYALGREILTTIAAPRAPQLT